jgi:hypothetical protein
MTESNKGIEDRLEKIDSKLNQTTLIKILDNTLKLIEKVTWPIIVLKGIHGL